MAKIFSSAIQTTVITPNQNNFRIEVIAVPVGGTPVQLPDIPVPDGVDTVIKAKTTNKSKIIYIANSIANCAIITKRAELRAGEAIGLSITNTNLIYIDASANDAEIELILET
jgi:diacylglycerol kinase family enzyme